MKRFFTIFLFLLSVVESQTRMLSPIPVPNNTVIDLDPTIYDRQMLQNALDAGELLTFWVKSKDLNDPQIDETRRQIAIQLNLFRPTFAGGQRHIALVMSPEKIGQYAVSISESALAYLLHRRLPFNFTVLTYSKDENRSLSELLPQIGSDYTLMIAPVTPEDAELICASTLSTRVYIPTLNAKRVDCANPMVTFGGIDYEKEIETLSGLVESNDTTIAISDQSRLSMTLTQMVSRFVDLDDTIVLERESYYKSLIDQHEDLNQSTIFLNTPVVRSSLFLSQLTLADYHPLKILSTQLNYSPMLLTLTQYHDRENMIVASEISKTDPFLEEEMALIGRDIRFNWLNYTTIVGLDYYDATYHSLQRLTSEQMDDNGVIYTVHHYRAGLYRFIPKELPTLVEEAFYGFQESEEPLTTPYAPDSQFESSEKIDRGILEGLPSLR